MGKVGKPEEFNAYPEHDPDYTQPTHSKRPEGGFLEERITKLEWEVGVHSESFTAVRHALGVEDSQLNRETKCVACYERIVPVIGYAFPMCKQCLKVIANLKAKQESWWFKE